MQNAERRMQNDLIPLTLHSQGNELNAERGVRSTERLCSAELRKQGNYYIFILMSVVQRSEDNSAFCILRSAFKQSFIIFIRSIYDSKRYYY